MPESGLPEGMSSITVHNWPLRVTVAFPDVIGVEGFEKIRAALGPIVKELESIQAEAAKKVRETNIEPKTGDDV
jgi:hypothetical protein